MTSTPKTPFKNPTDAGSWAPALVILTVSVGLSYILGEDEGWAIGASVAAIGALIQWSWPLRRQSWFWIAVIAFAAIHAWAVHSLDWSWISHSRRLNGTYGSGIKGLALLWCADTASMMAAIYGIYCLKYGKPLEASEASVDELPRYNSHDLDL